MSRPSASLLASAPLPLRLHTSVEAAGAPAALVSGTQYYLYALADIGVPITRCLFTY